MGGIFSGNRGGDRGESAGGRPKKRSARDAVLIPDPDPPAERVQPPRGGEESEKQKQYQKNLSQFNQVNVERLRFKADAERERKRADG